MDFGQWAALAVVVGIIAVGVTTAQQTANADKQSRWNRDIQFFGVGVLMFGLVSCVLVAAGVNISFS